MKLFGTPIVVTSMLGICLVLGFAAPSARADFTFGEPVNLKLPTSVFDGTIDDIDCFSSDGLEMYIDSFRAGGLGGYDLWVLRRASVDDDWGSPENLGPAVNSAEGDYFASISTDGLSLYFCSWRDAPFSTGHDIYVTTRATKDSPWGPAVNVGPSINSSTTDGEPWISPDGLELYLVSGRSDGYGSTDFYVAKRATTDDPWGDPLSVGPEVNSLYREDFVSLSPDGLLLLFSDYPFSDTFPRRPDGYGGADMWMTRRVSLSDSWQTPVNLGPIVNTSADEGVPRISPDGSTLYFYSSAGDVADW